MRRAALLVALVTIACGSPKKSAPADEPARAEKNEEKAAAETTEKKAEKPTPEKTDPEPEPPPPEPEPVPEVPAAKDPLAVLMTPGNKWTYRAYYGWHASYWSIYEITREVTEVERIGPYEVATIKQTVTPPNSENDGSDGCVRVRKGDQVWLFEWDYEGADTPAGMRKMLAKVDPEMDLEVAHHDTVCSFVGCFGGRTRSFDVDSWAGFWPGVGIVAEVRGGYSVETGDGNTRHLMLTGFELSEPIPTLHTGDEPPELATLRRKVHAVAKARDVPALRKLLRDIFWYSLHDEHRWAHGVEDDWKGLDAGWKTLADATALPCATLDTDPMVAVCPSAVAHEHVRATGRNEYQAPETKPRAYFEHTKEGWRPVGTFTGGPADVFWDDEASDDPPRPMKAYALPERD